MAEVGRPLCAGRYSLLTVDVEEWFHVLDCLQAPPIEQWSSLESRVERSLRQMLPILSAASARATFFWLGWVAERHKALVRECQQAGHEIASHGYAHILPYEVGEEAFRQDIQRAKAILEDITGERLLGFRAAGFGITEKAAWAFGLIKEAGYEYDASVFPTSRGHGGIRGAALEPHFIETHAGRLFEVPASMVEVCGWRTSVFGGGYLRLAPMPLIKWGVRELQKAGRPLVIYLHPREIDPEQPRLPLSLHRRFKYYVNLRGTRGKLEWLCGNNRFCTMGEYAQEYLSQSEVRA